MKNIISVILFLCFLNPLPAQQRNDHSAEIETLYGLVTEYQVKKDYRAVMETLLKILELNPEQENGKRFLFGGLRGYFPILSQDSDLIDRIMKHFVNVDEINMLPLGNLLAHYYEHKRFDYLQQLVGNISIGRVNSININPLFKVDHSAHPDFFSLIINAIRPYVDEKRLSVNLFIALYSEDADYRLEELEADFGKVIKSDICKDSVELANLLNLCINQDMSRNLILLDEIFDKLRDCFEENNTMDLAVYYYISSRYSDLSFLLDKIEYEGLPLIQDPNGIKKIDPDINPELANRLLRLYWSKIPEMEERGVQYITYLYNKAHYSELIVLLNRIEDKDIPIKVRLEDYLDIDVSQNPNIAGQIFQLYWQYINNNNLSGTQGAYLLYDCVKQLYSVNLYYQSESFLRRIIDIVEFDEDNYRSLVIKGIASLLLKEDRTALKIFNQITNIGFDEEKKFLAQELHWWSPTLNSDIVDRTLSSLSEYQPPSELSGQLQSTDLTYQNKAEDSEVKSVAQIVNYHALLIGVKDYEESRLNLIYPISDVNNLAKVILDNYTFELGKVHILENPTRAEIFRTLISLKNSLGPNDNLLIFYAGHGWWDEEMGQGYWLPSDAESNVRVNWITNSEITEYIKAIKTKHTLLISDACFSGSIFKTRSAFINDDKNIELIYKKPSRKAITSGTLISVPDKSVFIEYLINKLEVNDEAFLPAEKLYLNFRDAVTNNSINKQRPLYGEIWNSGDEGGDFIFIKKNNDQ